MKIKKIVYYILMFLPLIVTLAALLFLPEQIPAHYDFNNQVTRWGSKYETLIFPVITIIFGVFMLGLAKYSARHEETGRNNEKACIMTGIVSLILFNVMTGYFLYTDFNKIENLSSVKIGINQVVFGTLGVSMIVIGNIMPKLRMNSFIGLRTSWSMKNETTWKKSQRFGGISFVAAGAAIVLISFLAKESACILWSLVVVMFCMIADVFYTYWVAKNVKLKGKEYESRIKKMVIRR